MPVDLITPTIARVLIVVPFLVWGLDMFLNVSQAERDFRSASYSLDGGPTRSLLPGGINMQEYWVYLAAFGQVACSLGIMFGYLVKFCSLILALITILGTLIYHIDLSNPLAIPSPAHVTDILKNVSIIGGLLLAVSHGGGKAALDCHSPTVRVVFISSYCVPAFSSFHAAVHWKSYLWPQKNKVVPQFVGHSANIGPFSGYDDFNGAGRLPEQKIRLLQLYAN